MPSEDLGANHLHDPAVGIKVPYNLVLPTLWSVYYMSTEMQTCSQNNFLPALIIT